MYKVQFNRFRTDSIFCQVVGLTDLVVVVVIVAVAVLFCEGNDLVSNSEKVFIQGATINSQRGRNVGSGNLHIIPRFPMVEFFLSNGDKGQSQDPKEHEEHLNFS